MLIILIFLRNTAFGTELKMRLKDPQTDEDFEHTVDLSELTYKEFDLKADGNGEYPYFMEKSKVNITFKFLLKKDEDELAEMEKSWNGLGTAPVVTKRLEKLSMPSSKKKSFVFSTEAHIFDIEEGQRINFIDINSNN